MKASTEQYFPGILFIMLQKVILTLESVDETLKCVYSSENYWGSTFLWHCLLCCTRWF